MSFSLGHFAYYLLHYSLNCLHTSDGFPLLLESLAVVPSPLISG